MAQGYSRSEYPGGSILPPLQRNRSQPQGSNDSTRGYFDPSSATVTPILPSQLAPEGDRFGSTAGPAAFDPTGSVDESPN